MIASLCITVMFIDPLFHGRGDDDPEWPPSPMRLFQALLAGARTGCRGVAWTENHAAAFRWLARQEPPLIVAPAAQPAVRCTYFVPNNDGDVVFDRQDRLTTKIATPHRLVDGEAVHYVWPIRPADGSSARAHAGLLCDEARYLLALGWGIDQVVGNGRILSEPEVAALPGRRWRAWGTHRTGSQTWRVPVDGSLEDLEDAYGSFVARIDGRRYHPPRKATRFDAVHYLSSATLPPRRYAAFELPEGVGFRPDHTAAVAAMLRSLACRCARSDTHLFPGGSETYVAGHVEPQDQRPPRFSYLPLPTIGHEHADGVIRRLLIGEPFGGDGTHAHWAQQRLRNAILRDQHGSDRGVLLDLWRPRSRRVIRRYVDEARAWSTVTPVILPGFDEGKGAKAERLVLKAGAQAEIPVHAIDGLTLRKAPFWPGAQHPRRYAVPDYLRHLPGWHVWIRFREPVPGPLAIGAGRHVGLGLLAVAGGAG